MIVFNHVLNSEITNKLLSLVDKRGRYIDGILNVRFTSTPCDDDSSTYPKNYSCVLVIWITPNSFDSTFSFTDKVFNESDFSLVSGVKLRDLTLTLDDENSIKGSSIKSSMIADAPNYIIDFLNNEDGLASILSQRDINVRLQVASLAECLTGDTMFNRSREEEFTRIRYLLRSISFFNTTMFWDIMEIKKHLTMLESETSVSDRYRPLKELYYTHLVLLKKYGGDSKVVRENASKLLAIVEIINLITEKIL